LGLLEEDDESEDEAIKDVGEVYDVEKILDEEKIRGNRFLDGKVIQKNTILGNHRRY